MSGSLNEFLDAVVGKDVREQFRNNLAARENTPSVTDHFICRGELPEFFISSTTLWIGELQSLLGSRRLSGFLGHHERKGR